MHIRTRRKLLATLTAIFCIGGFLLIFFSQGFSLDVKTGTIEKRGGIYLTFSPRNATLAINGKTRKTQRGFLSPGTFVSNLRAGSYELVLTQEEFETWRKTITVQPGIVTSENAVRLWRTEPSTISISSSSQPFFVTRMGLVTGDAGGALAFRGQTLKGKTVLFSNPESDTIITKSGEDVFVTDLSDDSRKTINVADLFQSLKEQQLGLPGVVPIERAAPHPFNTDKVLLTTRTSLYILDLKKVQLERVITTANLQPFLATGSQEALVIDSRGTIMAVDLIFKTTESYALRPLAVRRFETTSNGKTVIIVDSEQSLLVYDTEHRIVQELSETITDFVISPEGKRLAFAEPGKGITVFFLEDRYEENEKRERGSRTKIEHSELTSVHRLLWSPEIREHIIALDAEGELTVRETSKTLPQNSAVLARGIVQAELFEKELIMRNQTETFSMGLESEE